MDTTDEERIIERCRAGDVGAYKQIYDRYGQPLLRTATRLLGRPQEAEDAVQETFLKLFRGIKGFRKGAKFSTYLFQILHNTCIDALRKRKPTAEMEDMAALGVSSSNELAHSLAQAVDRLPVQMRACFVLFAVEEFSQEEAAAILGVSVGTIKAGVHRARKKLQAWLGSCPTGEIS
jgi:RNA polymerase sigma-70 factor (ECF subfamily)